MKKLQENTIGYDRQRQKVKQYRVEELVAIKRIQQGLGLKFLVKFLALY